jgi:hypothetical protein
MKCGIHLICEGDSTLRLLNCCGEPNQVEELEDRLPLTGFDQASGEYVTEYEVRGYEIWIYDFGPLQPTHRLTIRYGKVHRIESCRQGF